jgi:hypothetical protein
LLAAEAEPAASLPRREISGRAQKRPLQLGLCAQRVEECRRGERAGLPLGREFGGIEQALTGRNLEAAGTADDQQAWDQLFETV